MTESGAHQVPSPATPGTIALIEGTAFCVCLASGDIVPGGTDGVFYRDTRLVSRWELLVDGDPVEPMAVLVTRTRGTPVVALNRGSVPEVADGVTGFVLDHPADLPAAIRKAGDLDPAACRSHVEGNFDVTVMAEGYERLYAHAVARAPRANHTAPTSWPTCRGFSQRP